MFNPFIQQNNVQDNEYYNILGVSRNSNLKDIKKAYWKLARVHHPDKGGDEEKFKEINLAYEILSDAAKRAKYDKFGKQGLNQNDFDPFQFFDFFKQNQHKTKTHIISVSLEDLYRGKILKLKVNKHKTCDKCSGNGGIGNYKTCYLCKGSGVQNKLYEIMPGLMQTTRIKCKNCDQKGKIYSKKCENCKGTCLVENSELVNINIPPGTLNGYSINIDGQIPTENIKIIIEEKEHKIYKRRDNDLYTKYNIDLASALCGLPAVLQTLDGRLIGIKTDDIISDGKIYKLKNEGMPLSNLPTLRGDLFICFNIVYPKKLDPADKELLQTLLPATPKISKNIKINTLNPVSNNVNFPVSENHTENFHPEGVQCHQQ